MTNEKKYSLIIIGGGIVGLSSAIAWAINRNSSQFPVLLMEKQPLVGGMVTSFRRKGYTFDTAQLIPDLSSSHMVSGLPCKLVYKLSK
jgi:protoporphyrinogen oxidase